jgi:catechol 2,3-dioxygenase-like lactoylglutathione lyase family enzyme
MAGTSPAMTELDMPRVVGIDHLVLSVGDLARSKAYYRKVLGFLGFRLKHDLSDFAGWSNGKTLFWIAQADSVGAKRKHRKGDIGFHHYAFELDSRAAVDALGAFLQANDLPVADPPDSYNGDEKYYAVFFHDPDGMRLEAMHYGPAKKRKTAKKKR